jgi:hypothetical protein
MRMKSVPQIEVLLIESGEPPTGVGEVSVPTAPALSDWLWVLDHAHSAQAVTLTDVLAGKDLEGMGVSTVGFPGSGLRKARILAWI